MKHLVEKLPLRIVSYALLAASTLLLAPGCTKEDNATAVLSVTPVATGLKGPIGLEMDKNGWLWIGQSGTAVNDGKVSALSPAGNLVDVITGFPSVPSPGGEPDGPTHLLFANDSLYILGTGGKMYIVAQSLLKPGVTTLSASSLKVEDIGAFVLNYPFTNNAHDTHPYNFAVGPNGAIYIVDAAANAILRREPTGKLSVVAEVPGLANPTPVGPPMVESVPTAAYYNSMTAEFFITTLTGFPFATGNAVIYNMQAPVSGLGTSTVYQKGFSTLVDIAVGGAAGKVVLEHGSFGQMGWMPNTGRLLQTNGTTISVIADGLNQPAGLKQVDEHTWYVTSFGDNTVLKVTN